MIDWTRLNDLRAEIGEEDLAEVVSLFLEEADEVVASIAALETDEELEAQLHFLKGSALNLGLSDLAGLCQEGERAAAQGHGATVDRNRICTTYAASKSAFLGALTKGTAA